MTLLMVISLMLVDISNDLLDFQKPIMHSRVKYPLLLSGYGAGKTHVMVRKVFQLAWYNQGYMGLACEPRNEDIDDVFLPAWNEFCDDHEIFFKYNTQKKRITLSMNNKETIILLRHMEKPERIVGKNIAYACVDEIDTLPYKKAKMVYNKIIGRMRVGHFRQLCFFTTPEGFKFAWETWEKKPTFHHRIYRAKTTDNPYLPDDYIQTMRENYDSKRLDAYINGKFVNLETGAVWSCFDRGKHIKEKVVDPGQRHYTSWDFGWNHPTAVGLYEENRQTGHVHQYDEVVISGSQITDTINIVKLKQKEYGVVSTNDFCDPAGKQNRETQSMANVDSMRINGLNPIFSISSISEGIVIGNNKLEKGKFTISERCQKTIESLTMHSYKVSTDGIASNDVEEQYKDCSDQFRYFMYNMYRYDYDTWSS